ncbi:MAG TPA: integrase, partial [Sphingomicrobium sp.]|nr:integrase [Sphingomicrobium sp.]
MKRKTALPALSSPSVHKAVPEGEIVTVLAPGAARLPRRRARPGLTIVERFVAVLSSLVDGDTTVAKVNFTKALEARSPATLRAMTCDLESYALFVGAHAGAGLPASAERLAEWIDHLEASRQKP